MFLYYPHYDCSDVISVVIAYPIPFIIYDFVFLQNFMNFSEYFLSFLTTVHEGVMPVAFLLARLAFYVAPLIVMVSEECVA